MIAAIEALLSLAICIALYALMLGSPAIMRAAMLGCLVAASLGR